MANQSIYDAFQRMWQHVVAVVGSKSDINHNHDNAYDSKGAANTAESNAKTYADGKFASANTYTDNAVTQKTQVQIITWEADD